MRFRIQLTPELTAAVLCTAGWYLFWMAAFHPVPVHTTEPAAFPRPSVTLLDGMDPTLRQIRNPALFALPAQEGFSGDFLKSRIGMRLSLEKPVDPARYLERRSTAAPAIDSRFLTGGLRPPTAALPIPGATAPAARQSLQTTRIFFSPELAPRAEKNGTLNLPAAGLPESLRVHLTVREDGTVSHAFFETPVTLGALISAVRELRFAPDEKPATGWIDIRFVQEGPR